MLHVDVHVGRTSLNPQVAYDYLLSQALSNAKQGTSMVGSKQSIII